MDQRIEQFYRQYVQQVNFNNLSFPFSEVLLEPSIQGEIYFYMFDTAQVSNTVPYSYQRRVLKAIIEKIESAIKDPDQDEISDGLVEHMAYLSTIESASPVETAQQTSVVTYHSPLPFKACERSQIKIEEARNLLASSGATGYRVWDACLHLAYFLSTEGRPLVENKTVLELGAGTGLLAILCAALKGSHVLATDKEHEMIDLIERNVGMNRKVFPYPSHDVLEARVLDWTDTVDLGRKLWYKGKSIPVDLVLGSDVTYDVDLIEDLFGIVYCLFSLFPTAVVLICATVRNEATFAALLKECDDLGVHVSDIQFQCPPLGEQKGFFHQHPAPIRIIKIVRG